MTLSSVVSMEKGLIGVGLGKTWRREIGDSECRELLQGHPLQSGAEKWGGAGRGVEVKRRALLYFV